MYVEFVRKLQENQLGRCHSAVVFGNHRSNRKRHPTIMGFSLFVGKSSFTCGVCYIDRTGVIAFFTYDGLKAGYVPHACGSYMAEEFPHTTNIVYIYAIVIMLA